MTGLNSILPKEHGNKFYNLPIIRHLEKDVCAVAAWDSSIHDSIYLNRVTEGQYKFFSNPFCATFLRCRWFPPSFLAKNWNAGCHFVCPTCIFFPLCYVESCTLWCIYMFIAANERVYLILKTTVHLSHPATMDLVLRKRLSLNIYKRQSIADRIRRKIVKSDCLNQCGVTYEVVSNIPKVCMFFYITECNEKQAMTIFKLKKSLL